jgi:hypothetical protein
LTSPVAVMCSGVCHVTSSPNQLKIDNLHKDSF